MKTGNCSDMCIHDSKE